MIDPVTTTLVHDRQHELLQQAERDRLLRGARPAGNRRRRQRFSVGIPAIVSRLFTARAPGQIVGEDEPAGEDTPTAA
jgi:hypothetical protein